MTTVRRLIGRASGFTRVEMDADGNIYGVTEGGPWRFEMPLITAAETEEYPAHAISAVLASSSVPVLKLTAFDDEDEPKISWLIPDINHFEE